MKIIKGNAPCLDCTDRTADCHGTCAKYGIYKVKVQAERERENKQKMLDYDFTGYKINKHERLKRRDS